MAEYTIYGYTIESLQGLIYGGGLLSVQPTNTFTWDGTPQVAVTVEDDDNRLDDVHDLSFTRGNAQSEIIDGGGVFRHGMALTWDSGQALYDSNGNWIGVIATPGDISQGAHQSRAFNRGELVFANVPLVAGEQYFTQHIHTNDVSTGMSGLWELHQAPRYTDLAQGVVCFSAGTHVLSLDDTLRIEDVQVGDVILTQDNGLQSVRWVGHRKIDAIDLVINPKLSPVRICAGALGRGLPERDLLVSRQHRMLVSSAISKRLCGEQEVLVPAIKLVGLPGIYVDTDVKDVTYIHLLFDRHEVIFAEGAPSESLFTGSEALKSVGAESREEILGLFPELADDGHIPVSARELVDGKTAKKLTERHKKNNRALLSSEFSLPQLPVG